jgi:hypothetical protein
VATLLTYALTNLSDVKESLGLASSDTTKDNLCIRKINQVTKQIENYCGRRFQATTYTQIEYGATDVDELILRQRPIITFTTLEIRDAGLNVNNWETIDPQLYFVDSNSGVLNLMFQARGRWNRYRVTYTAGYQTIPADLAEAASILACYYVRNPNDSGVGVLEMREGSRLLKYANTSLKFRTIMENLGIDDVLDSYSNMPLMTDR